MSLLVICVGIASLATAAFAASALRRRPCPACSTRLLKMTAHRRVVDLGETWSETAYRCAGCGGEFMQRGRGSLVPRHAWDRGVRDGIPPARLLR